MKTFIWKIAHFSFFLISLFIIIGTSLKYYEFQKLLEYNYKNKYKLNNAIGVFGHSHPHTAINPDIFNQLNSHNLTLINYSLGGQSMFWSVMNARQAYNLGCRNFVFEVTNNTFSTRWKTTDFANSSRETQKILLTKRNELYFILKQPNALKLIHPFLSQLKSPENMLNGHYRGLTNTYENFDQRPPQLQKDIELKEEYNSDLLIDFIRSHPDCKFLLFRAPLHPQYLPSPASEKLLNKFKIKMKEKNIDFVDCKEWIYQNQYFSDLEHLNKFGADTFTKRFSKYIELAF